MQQGRPLYAQTHEADALDDLPSSVRPIAAVIGRRAALYLIGQLPVVVAGKPGKQSRRVQLYVPKTLDGNHRLVQILGQEKATALAQAFGGESLQPANCRWLYARHRDDAIVRMLADGAPMSVVCSVMRVSRRHVTNVLRARGIRLHGAGGTQVALWEQPERAQPHGDANPAAADNAFPRQQERIDGRR
nr:MAG TPA: Mor transcription activator family [Caudoviricetes sp.]